jgi:hypothetical protein
MPKYIAGGVYPHARDEFLLVRPSGKDTLPYVSSHPHGSLWSSTRHHSHLYRIEGDVAFLERFSWEAERVEAPLHVKLTPLQVYEIENSFEKCDYK